MDIFMFARYAKEDFDSDDWEKKRTVIKQLGADLKLSGRTIQFTPVKYLVLIEKTYPELKEKMESVRTDSQQMKKGLKEGLISEWCTTVKEVATMLKEDLIGGNCPSYLFFSH